jgi:hypothetical protein
VCWLLLHLTSGFPADAQIVAKPIKLGWNAATDMAVRGYAIYYGRTNLTATTRINAGTNLSCTISGLLVGVTYRIYAVSYDAQGIESLPSNQVTFTPITPAPTNVPPRLQIARQTNGSMTLSYAAGTNTTCAIQFAATPTAKYWQTLTNVAANAAGNIIITDTSASRVPQRFYRVALTPQPLVSSISIARLSNGTMKLNWQTPPRAVCRVQSASSPTATTWTTRATVTSNDEGQAVCIDSTAAQASTRFYRVAMP